MPSHRTVGKVTYIHGGTRYPSARNYPPAAPISLDERARRTVAMQMQYDEHLVPDLSSLNDPALQVQPKPIPVIAIGDGPVDVEVFYGGPASGNLDGAMEPDEFDVWRTPPAPRQRIRWVKIALTTILIAGCSLIYLTIALLVAQTWRFWFQ